MASRETLETAVDPALTPATASLGEKDGDAAAVKRFRLRIVEGSQAGCTFDSGEDRLQIGSHPMNNVHLNERTVSRFHCEVCVETKGRAWVIDLGSRNGTKVDGVRVREAELVDGSVLQVGKTRLRFEALGEHNQLLISTSTRFGALVGASVAARSCFALLERAAATDVTVLLEGETGTGKSQAAEAVHAQSLRQAKPFGIVDCAAVPSNLLESELFGHEQGAFTGARDRRLGVFEEANGGTVFLDEVGELHPELQPKLLRVLEAREVRRVGSNRYQPVNVRLIAATNRDLRAEVNAGRFRPDLYYRLAVFRVTLPSLRRRPEDIPLIAEQILARMALDKSARDSLSAPAFLARLRAAPWPGNARELRNHLERCAVMQESLHPSADELDGPLAPDLTLPYPESRRRTLEAFEHAYVRELLQRHGGNVSQAAVAGQLDRVYLHRLIKKHRLKS